MSVGVGVTVTCWFRFHNPVTAVLQQFQRVRSAQGVCKQGHKSTRVTLLMNTCIWDAIKTMDRTFFLSICFLTFSKAVEGDVLARFDFISFLGGMS